MRSTYKHKLNILKFISTFTACFNKAHYLKYTNINIYVFNTADIMHSETQCFN